MRCPRKQCFPWAECHQVSLLSDHGVIGRVSTEALSHSYFPIIPLLSISKSVKKLKYLKKGKGNSAIFLLILAVRRRGIKFMLLKNKCPCFWFILTKSEKSEWLYFCVLVEDAPLWIDTILHFEQLPFVFTKIYLNNGHCFQEWIEFGWMLQEILCLGSKQSRNQI